MPEEINLLTLDRIPDRISLDMEHRAQRGAFLWASFLTFLAASTPSFAGSRRPSEPVQLSYTFDARVLPESSELIVGLEFQGSESGKTLLKLPSKWANADESYRAISHLHLTSTGAALSDTDSPELKAITHAPNQLLRLEYRLRQDTTGEMQVYRPILQKDYLFFIGESALVIPELPDEQVVRVHLRWKNLPHDWAVANSFGVQSTEQGFIATPHEFRHALYEAGDFAIEKILIGGDPLFIATRGSWKFSHDEFVRTVGRIVRSERGFWGKDRYPFFLITLMPTDKTCCDYSGTALTNAFAAFFARDASLEYAVRYIFSHELFHTWNGHLIGKPQDEKSGYWFSEGFTDYYARLLDLRAGVLTLEEYVDDYNRVLYKYYTSPFRIAPNVKISAQYWMNADATLIPYLRGDILAHEWNLAVRNETHGKFSLDDAMRRLGKAAKRNGAVSSVENIDMSIRPYLRAGILNQVEEHITNGALLTPSPGALGPCVDLVESESGRYESGFDLESSAKNGVVAQVKAKSAAYTAGLRDGQVLLDHRTYDGVPWKSLEMEIADRPGGSGRWIRYSPTDGAHLKFPAYRLNLEKYAATPQRCLEWFDAH